MNKTIDISLAGLLFHLEESAYYKLKNYLQLVRNSLNSEEDTDEIMNEVEARIAELLMKKQTHPNEVVNEKQIDEIIEIIGKPEEFEDEEPEKRPEYSPKKSLFRDPDQAMIGGVAAGFAHYLGIDVTLMRILFLILLFVTKGSFLLIYILLWIIIPKAKTVSDKLKMKGEKVSLDNIVENVSNEQADMKNSPMGENIERMGAGLGEVILKLLGLFLAFISGIVLLGLIISALAISPLSDFSIIVNQDAAVFQHVGMPLMWLNILTLLLVGIPFALLFILGLKLLFPHIKSLSRNVLLILGTIWIISLIVLSVKTVSGIAHKSFDIEITESQTFYSPKDTLILKINDNNVSVTNQQLTDDDIRIYFEESPDSLFHFRLVKTAEGINEKEARKAANKLVYPVDIDTLHHQIVLSSRFLYPAKYGYSDYDLEIFLMIPKGKAILIGENADDVYMNYDCEEGEVIFNREGQIYCSNQNPEKDENDRREEIKIQGDGVNISIDEKGLKIKAKDKDGKKAVIEIDEKGVKVKKDR